MDRTDRMDPTEGPALRRVQEALSRRFAFRASVTPLEDGSFAVFALDLSAESMTIVETSEELALAVLSRANRLPRKTPTKAEVNFDEVDFEGA